MLCNVDVVGIFGWSATENSEHDSLSIQVQRNCSFSFGTRGPPSAQANATSAGQPEFQNNSSHSASAPGKCWRTSFAGIATEIEEQAAKKA